MLEIRPIIRHIPMTLIPLLLSLSFPCDPLGSSEDAAFCSLCSDIESVCSSSYEEERKVRAGSACSLSSHVPPSAFHTQWLVDLACDASKVAYGAGELGFVTLWTGNISLSKEKQWGSIFSVCGSSATRRALQSVCSVRRQNRSFLKKPTF